MKDGRSEEGAGVGEGEVVGLPGGDVTLLYYGGGGFV